MSDLRTVQSKPAQYAFGLLVSTYAVKRWLSAATFQQLHDDLSLFLRRDSSPGATAYARFMGGIFERDFIAVRQMCPETCEVPVLVGARALVLKACELGELEDVRLRGWASPGGDAARDSEGFRG